MTPTEYRALKPAPTSKYGNQYWTVDGIRFQSKREATRFGMLKMMERGGVVTDLKRQVWFDLKVKDKLVCRYRADFTYWRSGIFVVEDSKGARTAEFIIKAKLFEAVFGYKILET